MIANTLIQMGYVLDVDFVAYSDKGVTKIDWLSDVPRPTDADIQAAIPAAVAAEQAEQLKRVEAATARDDAKRALSALDTIISGIDGATLAQAKTAIKQLAQIQRHIILATVGR